MKASRTVLQLTLFIIPWLSHGLSAQPFYCEPEHGTQFLAPILNGVAIGTINNQNTTVPVGAAGYSNYTTQQTTLNAGGTYDITIGTGDPFPHHFAAYIDYDRDFQFQPDERIGSMGLGGSDPMSSTITFTVPNDALSGPTRLRVRGISEPFGPWNGSDHPCAPVTEGEAEDYTVVIAGGLDIDGGIVELLSPITTTGMGNEVMQVWVANRGTSTISSATVELKVDNVVLAVEPVPTPLASGALVSMSFTTTVDFSSIGCKEVQVSLDVPGDGISDNDQLVVQVCNVQPITGSDVWYIHSNQFFPIEVIGMGTTNETTMNTVFGTGNWQLGYFETLNTSQVLSPSTCTIFIDGSFGDVDPMQTFLNAHGAELENWVAAGGKLFLNSSPGSMNAGGHFTMPLGFGDVELVQGYDVGFATAWGTHSIHSGPYQPAGSDWTAFNYSEGVIQGRALVPIIVDDDDAFFSGPELNLPLLAEKPWGQGTVLFGTIGPSQLFGDPTTSMNSRFNILQYLSDCSISTGLGTVENDRGISIYPNPAKDVVVIEALGSDVGMERVEVLDLQGRVATYFQGPMVDQGSITVSDIAAGQYVMRVVLTDGSVQNAQIQIQR